MVELNCAGTVQLAKLVVQQMGELNAGKILFTASTAGEMAAPREAVDAATKAFVLSFAHSLRYELKETGISVTALQPRPPIRISSIVQGWTIPRWGRRVNLKADRFRSRGRELTGCWLVGNTSTLRRSKRS
jgi:NAD(P)-dependent dehydrogenase (short-subunit alcohol dehydrogenase family)